jgi:hypothetical protein
MLQCPHFQGIASCLVSPSQTGKPNPASRSSIPGTGIPGNAAPRILMDLPVVAHTPRLEDGVPVR